MIYGILADIVVIVHLFWILFLIAGAFLGKRYRPVMIVHGAGLVFALTSQFFGWYCPLTLLEVRLREQFNASQAYPGSFIAHYAEELVYIDLSPRIIFALTILLVGATVWIYWRALRKTAS